jgi:serine/threonine-protein kinase
MTQTGMSLGTPAYMAPEQATADAALDHRADLYSLGVLGYELLTGRPPFVGTPQQVLAAHLTQAPPPVNQLRPDVPAALANLVQRALAKSPDARWQRAGDMQAAFETLLHPSGATPSQATIPIPAPRPSLLARARQWRTWLIVFTVLEIAGIAWWAIATDAPLPVLRIGSKNGSGPN